MINIALSALSAFCMLFATILVFASDIDRVTYFVVLACYFELMRQGWDE